MSSVGLTYKLEGNRLFGQKKYEDAIKQYSKAINVCSSNAVFYTNRAVCNLKLHNYEEVELDCKRAIELDSQSVKGHFFIGHAEIEIGKYDDAIVHLTKALVLSKQQKCNFGDDMAAMLRLAKKKRWDELERKRMASEIELLNYLNGLIKFDKDRAFEKLKKNKLNSVNEFDQKEEQEIQNIFDDRYEELREMFAQVDQRRQKREVPDHLCGKISFEIMRDPVITPSGITYDRKDIEEHLQRVGHFDPVTRHKLTVNQLIPNLAMKEVIDKFIEENGWVEDY